MCSKSLLKSGPLLKQRICSQREQILLLLEWTLFQKEGKNKFDSTAAPTPPPPHWKSICSPEQKPFTAWHRTRRTNYGSLKSIILPHREKCNFLYRFLIAFWSIARMWSSKRSYFKISLLSAILYLIILIEKLCLYLLYFFLCNMGKEALCHQKQTENTLISLLICTVSAEPRLSAERNIL